MQNNDHTDAANKHILTLLGESTLTDAMTEAGKTYEEIAQLVAEQVGSVAVGTNSNITVTVLCFLLLNISCMQSVFTSYLWHFNGPLTLHPAADV